MKLALAYVPIKGIVMGIVTVAVVHASGLSNFAQALIIALVSAIIGALGVIVAALISITAARRIESDTLATREHVEAIATQLTEQKEHDNK